MRIEYSKTADALYVYFKEKPVATSKELEEGVVIDLDENNHVIGIELLDVSRRLTLAELANLTVENLPLEKLA